MLAERKSLAIQSEEVPKTHAGFAPLEVATNRCLNSRYKSTGCTRCANTCPAKAISLQSGLPQVDNELCVRCGICLHTCPTDVFTQRHAPESTLLEKVEQLPLRPLALICPLHPDPEHSRMPIAEVVRHGRCLGALSVEQLLSLCQDRDWTLWLDDSPCAHCPIAKAQKEIKRAAVAANHLLVAFNKSPSIYLHSIDVDQLLPEPETRPWLDGMQPSFSRRGFFGALTRYVHARRADAIEESAELAPTRATVFAERMPQSVPRSRNRLLVRLASIATGQNYEPASPVVTEGTSFAAVQVNIGKCSACGLCSHFCPTGALTAIEDGTNYDLNFQAAICIDCGICTNVCPENAVSMGDHILTENLISLDWQSLARIELDECRECGASTATGHGEGILCYACRQGAGTVRPLHDDAGLMADLLARLSVDAR